MSLRNPNSMTSYPFSTHTRLLNICANFNVQLIKQEIIGALYSCFTLVQTQLQSIFTAPRLGWQVSANGFQSKFLATKPTEWNLNGSSNISLRCSELDDVAWWVALDSLHRKLSNNNTDKNTCAKYGAMQYRFSYTAYIIWYNSSAVISPGCTCLPFGK